MTSNIQKGGHVAYFSMEIGIKASMPTYSGGLGVLSGDTLKSAADLKIPLVAVTLLYRKGYFEQKIDSEGTQSELPISWEPKNFMVPVGKVISVKFSGRNIKLQAWRYDLKGVTGHSNPIYFLDSDVEGNSDEDRLLTSQLYGGDNQYRLAQEILLGQGGVALLNSLGHKPSGIDGDTTFESIHTYHMNEGHSALLTLALLEQKLAGKPLCEANEEDRKWVRERCIFTTHTPVSAGHDKFSKEMAIGSLGEEAYNILEKFGSCPEEELNMSHLAISFSRFVNGVAKRHGEVSRKMFPEANVQAITNGIHAVEWTADSMRDIFDEYMPNWRKDNFHIRDACELPLNKIDMAHTKAKQSLFDEIKKRTGETFDSSIFTIGFARRAAEYKRADLLFYNSEKLIELANRHGNLQVIFAGKAHPKDEGGKKLIKNVVQAAKKLNEDSKGKIKVIYIQNYDMDLGRIICSGVDIWLNNPVKPLEASGTSGMKAALNGVPNLSTLDGWWVEGHVEGITGWEIEDKEDAFGADKSTGDFAKDTSAALYAKLDSVILPTFYKNHDHWLEIMRHSIAINGSFFNTHRMMVEYRDLAYS